MSIVFVKPNTPYDSYSDYFRLVELAGFPVIEPCKIEWDSDNVYICSPINGEFAEVTPAHRCRYVFWQLERYSAGLQFDRRFDETWVSDAHFAGLVKGYKHVVLGLEPGMRLATWEAAKVFDYAHLSYMNGRRNWILGTMEERGVRFAPSGWGEQRYHSLVSSKAVLSVHQDHLNHQEPIRYAIAAAHGVPLVAEFCEEFYPWKAERIDEPRCPVPLYRLTPPADGFGFRENVERACAS